MLVIRTMSCLRVISLTHGDAPTYPTLGSDLGHTDEGGFISVLKELTWPASPHIRTPGRDGKSKNEYTKTSPDTDFHRSRHDVQWRVVNSGNWGKNLLQRRVSPELGTEG